MNKLYTLLICTFLGTSVFGQQLPTFTQFRAHQVIINPAAISSNYYFNENPLSLGLSYRTQWIGVEGNPTTQAIQGTYIHEGNSFQLLTGGYIINDRAAALGATGAYGRIGALFTDDPYFGGISIGINAGVVQYRVNADQFRARDIDDISLYSQANTIYPDVGFGAYYYKRFSSGWLEDDVFYGGLSVPQLFSIDTKFENGNNEELVIERVQHFYALLGLYKFIDNDTFWEPSMWLRYSPNAPMVLDFQLRRMMNSHFWVGVGMSTNGIANLQSGFILGEENPLQISYSFDRSFRTFIAEAWYSHEIHLSYSFGSNAQ